MSNTPILCYHNIGHSPRDSRFKLLYVDPEKLARQLWSLRRLGLRGVSMREGIGQLTGHTRNNQVILTFDDGYVDTLTQALPVLIKFGCTATCYIVSDAIGGHNHWDADYLQENKPLMTHAHLQQWLAAGMEVGSHSRSHPRLRGLDMAAAEEEISGSRTALRAALGIEVEHFAYPFGSFDDTTADLVKRAGYGSAVSVIAGIARPTDDRYRLPRILVDGQRSWWRILLRLATPYESLRRRLRHRNTTRAYG